MNAAQLDALVSAAADGVSLDGLRVEADDGGYDLSTPDLHREGLDEAELREVAAANARYVTNWHYWARVVGDAGSARYAYLRWIERADERGVPERYERLAEGATRTWGELAVVARLDVDAGDGERRYEIRHRDDAGSDLDDLECHRDPLSARDIARFDARGRYRPLRTAPTLQSGWALVGLDGRDLVRAVGFIYPATVENWHREREGRLDVCDWRGTAARQTGIYDAVDELPDEAVAWGARAMCVDEACLKRRRWDLDRDRELGVERGDGEFPCREPCSLFVAAAREWALTEREEPRVYEFELTPGETEQIEALVDAASEGRLDAIGAGDVGDPANRYRVRYLRAKRFDDEGRLPEAGDPTEDAGDPAGG